MDSLERYLWNIAFQTAIWTKIRSNTHRRETSRARPGGRPVRAGVGEQVEERRVNSTPNGGPHLELPRVGRLGLNNWFKSNFSTVSTQQGLGITKYMRICTRSVCSDGSLVISSVFALFWHGCRPVVSPQPWRRGNVIIFWVFFRPARRCCCAAIRHVVELLSLLLYQVFVGGETLQLMLRSSFVTLPQNLHVQCTFVKWFSSQLLGEAEVLQVRTWHNCCVARL